MLKQIVFGILVMAVGGLIMYHCGLITEFIGRSSWADEHLGGTKNAVLLFGFLVFVLGGMMLFGMISLSNPVDTIPY